MHSYIESCLEEYLENRLVIGNNQYYFNADNAYMLRSWLQKAFEGFDRHNFRIEFNKSMKEV